MRRRPVILLSIFIDSHDEKLDWLVSGELIVNTFEQEIVPIENHILVRVFQCVRTEIDIANPAAKTCVPADLHQQMLLRACGLGGSVGFYSHKVAERAFAEDVIPAADLKRS